MFGAASSPHNAFFGGALCTQVGCGSGVRGFAVQGDRGQGSEVQVGDWFRGPVALWWRSEKRASEPVVTQSKSHPRSTKSMRGGSAFGPTKNPIILLLTSAVGLLVSFASPFSVRTVFCSNGVWYRERVHFHFTIFLSASSAERVLSRWTLWSALG